MFETLLPFLLVPAGLIAGGIFFALLGFRPRRADDAFIQSARRAPGVLTDLRWRSHDYGPPGDMTRMAYPVVRFTTADGKVVEVETTQARSPAPGRKGQAVTVLYDPADPTRVMIEDFLGQGRMMHGCIGFVGIALTLFGIGMGALLLLLMTAE